MAESELQPELAAKVDDLIRIFSEAPVIQERGREGMFREYTSAALRKMVDERVACRSGAGT